MRLQGKVAVITGAARGIGAATAAAFLREGARVCVCDVAPADSAVESQEHAGASMYQQVHDAFEAVVDRWGKLDILVNNAGITRDKSLLKMTDEQFDSVIDVNLKEAARLMAQQGGGVILNAASIVALDGNFGITNYAASKAGIVGMTKVWARELGSKVNRWIGLRVRFESKPTDRAPNCFPED